MAARHQVVGDRRAAYHPGVISRSPAASSLGTAIAGRRPLPLLAMTGVPLVVTASLVVDLWWSLAPLAVCAWWWAPRQWPWAWAMAVQIGVVGGAWASIGADALRAWPGSRLTVGAVWLGSAGALAATSWIVRRLERSRDRDARVRDRNPRPRPQVR